VRTIHLQGTLVTDEGVMRLQSLQPDREILAGPLFD
jgi:hypothetical protein